MEEVPSLVDFPKSSYSILKIVRPRNSYIKLELFLVKVYIYYMLNQFFKLGSQCMDLGT